MISNPGAGVQPIISIQGLTKTYASGFQALKTVDLEIRRGEIFALLGPNGAGKTTLISIICGIVNASTGTVTADGHDVVRDYRAARAKIGLVPQELTTDAFETVWATVNFSRGLFGKPPNRAYVEDVLRKLSLWDKKDSKIITLSGGMKRRVMIAKALSHEPQILFLDEPTAGVDVDLRRDMWAMVRGLRETGVTIILTTHYIDEAEEMADRIGVISKGEVILVEDKAELMNKLGKKQLVLHRAGRLPAGVVGGRRRTDLHLRRPGRRHRHLAAAQAARRAGHRLQGSAHQPEFAGGHLRQPGEGSAMNALMNWRGVRAIYLFEMTRFWRTLFGSLASPVISTALYFVVFGAAIGHRMQQIDGVSYGAFIVPGLIMMSLLTQSISNASFGIYFPKFTGTVYEILSAPISYAEVVVGYVGAAACKSLIIGAVTLLTARLFVSFDIAHPLVALSFLLLTSVTFCLFGFIIGLWADGFEKLQIIPLLVVTPLSFLGGSFYSVSMLPGIWKTVALFNPVVYLISGFRWSFYGIADVDVAISLAATVGFMVLCLLVIGWIFRTGYRLKA
jgi:ABC-2 type transport system ATP-binding protein